MVHTTSPASLFPTPLSGLSPCPTSSCPFTPPALPPARHCTLHFCPCRNRSHPKIPRSNNHRLQSDIPRPIRYLHSRQQGTRLTIHCSASGTNMVLAFPCLISCRCARRCSHNGRRSIISAGEGTIPVLVMPFRTEEARARYGAAVIV